VRLKKNQVDDMTPRQSRAARALLGLTQARLAEMADLSLSTIDDFEFESRPIPDGLVASMQVALEAAGVEFLPVEGASAGVRLKQRR